MERLTFVFLFGLLSLPACAEEIANKRTGYAYDISGENLIYTEIHQERYENNSIVSDTVTYKDVAGDIIAEKTIDYTDSTTMPDFKLVNYVTGHQESANKAMSELMVTFSKNSQARRESKQIPLPNIGIIDAGFDQFVIKNWKALIQGETLVRRMLIPSMTQFIEFRIYQDAIDTNKQRRILKVEPNSFLFRFFGDPLLLEYDMERPHLLTFKGTSNMRDKKGNNLWVSISFPIEDYLLSRK